MTQLTTKKHETKKEKLERQQVNDAISDLNSGDLAAETWLSDKARETFDFIMKNIEEAGPLVNLDKQTLNVYAEEYSLYAYSAMKLNETGMLVNDKPSPWFKIYHSQGGKVIRLAKELGLTPASRAKSIMHNVKSGNVVDPFEELLND